MVSRKALTDPFELLAGNFILLIIALSRRHASSFNTVEPKPQSKRTPACYSAAHGDFASRRPVFLVFILDPLRIPVGNAPLADSLTRRFKTRS